jgi:hypothetical protein
VGDSDVHDDEAIVRTSRPCRLRFRCLRVVVWRSASAHSRVGRTLESFRRRAAKCEVRLDCRNACAHPEHVALTRALVALLLVLLWLPASSHALMQQIGAIHVVHDDHHHDDHGDGAPRSHEHSADNHAAADGECLLTPEIRGLSLPAGVLAQCSLSVFVSAAGIDPVDASNFTGLAPPGVGPPQLSRIWQFLCRAAPSVRAPSLVS